MTIRQFAVGAWLLMARRRIEVPEVVNTGPAAPVITTTTLTTVTEGTAFSQQVIATGSPTPTFTVTAGTIIAGLSLSSGGSITGTPTTPGAYDFTVTATNSEGSDVQQYTGTVATAPTVGDGILLEIGDDLLLETGDRILIDA